MNFCPNCNKEIPPHYNFCDEDCYFQIARKEGAIDFCPNGLPPRIVYQGYILEHPHALHSDYKFPVEAEYIGDKTGLEEWELYPVQFALIYSDRSIALTIEESVYQVWSLNTGILYLSRVFEPGKYKLTAESIERIKRGKY